MKNLKANFGIDAPKSLKQLMWVSLLALTVFLIIRFCLPHRMGYEITAGVSLTVAFINLIPALLLILGSIYGKQVLIKKLVTQLNLTGAEQVVDIGCGSGIFAITVAKQLTSGNVTGIDIWSNDDQSNNSAKKTLENAKINGVDTKISVQDCDMRTLTFADNSIDLVVSSLAIHNLQYNADRLQTLNEIHRVLKPGGKLLLLDFTGVTEYVAHFKKLGWQHLKLSHNYYYVFPPVKILSGIK